MPGLQIGLFHVRQNREHATVRVHVLTRHTLNVLLGHGPDQVWETLQVIQPQVEEFDGGKDGGEFTVRSQVERKTSGKKRLGIG